jgi:hypothetical protein
MTMALNCEAYERGIFLLGEGRHSHKIGPRNGGLIRWTVIRGPGHNASETCIPADGPASTRLRSRKAMTPEGAGGVVICQTVAAWA